METGIPKDFDPSTFVFEDTCVDGDGYDYDEPNDGGY